PMSNFSPYAPTLADVDGDGLDEIFLEEEDGKLHAYHADGSVLFGWPRPGNDGQRFGTVAVGDLDADSIPEIVAGNGDLLYVFARDGSVRPGFPITIGGYGGGTYPVIG